jgi:hypothetical protein
MQTAKKAYAGGSFSGHPEEQLEEIEIATQAWQQRQAAQKRRWRTSPAVVEHHRSRLAEEQAFWADHDTPMPEAHAAFLSKRIAEAEAGLL